MKHPKFSPSAANALWLFLVAICHYLLVANLSAQLVGSGGLTGKYYNGTSFNTLAVTRIDPMLDFNWGSGSPSSSVDANNFSVRWTGMIQPRFSEPYYFSVIASQVTANVWINGSLVNAGPVDMKAGQFYSVKIEAVHATGTSASLRLAWESPSQLRETVASECLLPVELTTAYTPIAYPAYQSGGGFVAQWASVGGATGYRLDVATDSAFSGLVSGYNNLDVGNVTSKAVTGLASGKYYYRIRATWSGGTSSNSSTVPVDVVAMTLVSSNTYSTSGSATYTVPAGANRVLVKAWGSGGGGEYSESAMSVGGGGGFVSAAYSISANQTLSVYVGAPGDNGGAGGGATAVWRVGGFQLIAAGGGSSGGSNNEDDQAGGDGGAGGFNGAPGGAGTQGGGQGGNGATRFVPGGQGGTNSGGGPLNLAGGASYTMNWACLEKMDINSGDFDDVVRWLVFEGHR